MESGYELAARLDREAQWRAWKDFADHVLEGEAYWDEGRGARWVVRQPGTYIYYAEIIAGAGGSLVVHGDIDVVRFAHCGDHSDAWNRLRWMGHCTDIDYYVAQKASIGRACEAEQYDEDVAKAYLREMIRDEREAMREAEEEDRKRHAATIEAYKDALDHTENQTEMLSVLWHHGEYEYPTGLGMRTATRVLYAHAALNRCVSLLWEKYGYEGPPATRAKERAA